MFGLDQSAIRRRILVVDDDPDIRHLMAEVLLGTGYAVEVAENGVRAWNALHLHRFDLVVTDQEMPGMTGTQLVSKLRLAGFHMPVILASGGPPVDLMVRNASSAPVVMLPKPFTLGELLRMVGELLPASDASTAACREEMFSDPWQESFPRF